MVYRFTSDCGSIVIVVVVIGEGDVNDAVVGIFHITLIWHHIGIKVENPTKIN